MFFSELLLFVLGCGVGYVGYWSTSNYICKNRGCTGTVVFHRRQIRRTDADEWESIVNGGE